MGLSALGQGALALALAAAGTTAAVSRRRPAWGRRGLVATFALVTVALVALARAFVGQDYSLVYVADHASRETTWPYRLAGVWGGMAGSLLLWTWILSAWTLVASRSVRRRDDLAGLAGGTQAVLALTATVFLGLLVAVSDPFATLAVPAIDGGGLTPILRHPAMLYHPPLLYAGYVGLAVPFALAVAGGATAGGWLPVARRFMLASVVLLAVGMTAGAHWAYVELGWGGYWAWDPVENGALLPWLAGVAFLHSAVVGARSAQGLAFLAFALSLLGAFLTRSGVTDSVHAFAEARTVGRVLLGALAVTTVVLIVLAVRRRGPPDGPASPVLRVNNTLLLAVIVVVGFGLLFPVVSGDGVIVTGRYFAVVTAPLALGVLAAIGVGPRLGWRPRPWPEVRARLRPAGWGIAALAAAAVLLDAPRLAPLLMLGLAGSAAALTVAEWRSRSPRRTGGLLAHLGVAVLLAGVAGTATGTHRTASLVPGQSITVRDYTLRLDQVLPVPAPDGGRAAQATIAVTRGRRHLATLRPVALVARSGDRVSEAALRSTPAADLQVALRNVSGGGGAVVVEVFVVPLAQWVWWGALLTAGGIAAAGRGNQGTGAGVSPPSGDEPVGRRGRRR